MASDSSAFANSSALSAATGGAQVSGTPTVTGSSGTTDTGTTTAPTPGSGQPIPTVPTSPTINVYVQTPSSPNVSGGTRTTARPPAATHATTTASGVPIPVPVGGPQSYNVRPPSGTAGVPTSTPGKGYGGNVSNGAAYDIAGSTATTVTNPTNGLTAINLKTYHPPATPSVTKPQTAVRSGKPSFQVVRNPTSGAGAVNLRTLRVNPVAVAAVRKAQPRKAVSVTPNRGPVYGTGKNS
ncbi:MAG: hypothetical protein ACYCSN_14705, partial [Acidobacteriaceae bacterium]